MEIDINLETIHCATDTDTVRWKNGDGTDLLGLLLALGGGIVLASFLPSFSWKGNTRELRR
jgi:hypothetical protein